MKKILEYLPLFTICFLYFGFCNLYYYYRTFNIDIYAFMSSTDILLSFLPKIVFFSALVYGYIFMTLAESMLKSSKEQLLITNLKAGAIRAQGFTKAQLWARKNAGYILVTYFFAVPLLMLVIQKIAYLKPYDMLGWNISTDFIFLILFYSIIQLPEQGSQVFRNPILIGLFLIAFMGSRIGDYRSLEAQKIKDGKSDYHKEHMRFKYMGTNISTTDSILYIGATASYIFLYDRKDSTTSIYATPAIDYFKIR